MDSVVSLVSYLWDQFRLLPQETQFIVAGIGALWLLFNLRFSTGAVSNGPTILTTAGIFGTFVGIAIGLSHFDTANVQGSIPTLLNGLRTAVWASVVGIFGALTLKMREHFFGSRSADRDFEPTEEATATDIANLLRDIRRGLAGDDEGSLLSQIKLARHDANDRLDALKAAQNEALLKLSEMGSRQLVEALKDVIHDFNQKLTEQFGENFRELNAAVGRLVTWQEQYRVLVETAGTQFEIASGLIREATAQYASVIQRSETFSRVAADLNQLLSALASQKENLVQLLAELSNLLLKASGSLPQIEEKIVGLTDQMSNAMRLNQKQMNDTLTENATAMKAGIQAAHKAVADSNAEHSRQTVELMSKTKQQVSELDRALSDQLEKSLETLGQQLAALSEKFVTDYTPLTDRLRSVVDMAARLDRG